MRRFDWPGADAGNRPYRFDPVAQAPRIIDAEVVVEVQGDRASRRVDTWRQEIAAAGRGRVRHDMRYSGPRLPRRDAVEEAINEDGRVTTRTGSGPWLDRESDDRWQWLLARPASDFEELRRVAGLPDLAHASDPGTLHSEGPGGRASVGVRPDGIVTRADLSARGNGWSASVRYRSTTPKDALEHPRIEGRSPDRARPVLERRRLLEALGP